MERHHFKTYREYRKAQLTLTRRKMRKEKLRTFASEAVFQVIAEHHLAHCLYPQMGLCHGVRCGEEMSMLQRAFAKEYLRRTVVPVSSWRPGLSLADLGLEDCRWIGTEITPELCDGEHIICQDMSHRNPMYSGQFDVVYSNSLDHARRPAETLAVWLEQLVQESERRSAGRLYVEWTRWHAKLGQRGNTADCFAADQEEYGRLMDAVGKLERVLSIADRSSKGEEYERLVFVVQRKR